MTFIKNIITVILLSLFTYLFIYPAILFAILILGFTTSWSSGISMLTAAIILKIIVYLYSADKHTAQRKSQRDIVYSAPFLINKAPPPLNEIDYEVISSQWEEDLFVEKNQACGSEDNDYDPQPLERRCHYCNDAMFRNK